MYGKFYKMCLTTHRSLLLSHYFLNSKQMKLSNQLIRYRKGKIGEAMCLSSHRHRGRNQVFYNVRALPNTSQSILICFAPFTLWVFLNLTADRAGGNANRTCQCWWQPAHPWPCISAEEPNPGTLGVCTRWSALWTPRSLQLATFSSFSFSKVIKKNKW